MLVTSCGSDDNTTPETNGGSTHSAGQGGNAAGSTQATAGTSNAGNPGASGSNAGGGEAGGEIGGNSAGAGGSETAGSSAAGGPPAPPVPFAIIGDFGVDSGKEAVVAEMVKDAKPDFVITLGDNNYPDGEAATIDDNIGKYYSDFIGSYKGAYGAGSAENRFFPSAGNHDWNTGNLNGYLDYFDLPGNERYYDFVRGPVHFFALDSDPKEPDGTKASSKQAAWLRDALATSTAPFKIVYFHHPPYSSGAHGNTTTMQWPFAEWGASAVLCGHDHTYERFTVDGIPYIVNGLGGAGLYNFENLKPESEVRYNANHGAMFGEATPDKLTLRALSIAGETIDEVVLLPGAPPQTKTLVSLGTTWRYLDNGSSPPGWHQATFDDGAWKEGPAPLGYGDAGMATTVSDGGNANQKHITTCFRKSFSLENGLPLALSLSLRRDDGAVVYLNGQEILRSNMPAGALDSSTLADTTVSGADETTLFKSSVPLSALISGANLLAVELHQADPTSSDLAFDLELKATLSSP